MSSVPFEGTARYSALSRRRLRAAKAAYTTRHVGLHAAAQLLTGVAPRVGDLVLARVNEIGQHAKLELAQGRRASMFPGDEIVVAYGNRYAPDAYEAVVPTDLGPCDLVAAGGVAGKVTAEHMKMDLATTLEPIGLLVDSSRTRLGLHSCVRDSSAPAASDRPVTIAVVGASMNSGKTTTAAHLVRGLRQAGLRVGAAKTTGTGAGGDVWLLTDAGASPVYDFTDAGYPSTYRIGHQAVIEVFVCLTDRLAAAGCQVCVLEVADGVFQEETAGLLVDPVFDERVDAVLFASSEAVGAAAGADWLRHRGLAPIAISGMLTSSPLATRETEAAADCPVWGMELLSDPQAARSLFDDLLGGRGGSHGDPAHAA